MTDAHDEQVPATPGHDRRAFLQRVGIGAVAAGAWVAPQVLFTSTASAGCTPITKLLQINPATCTSGVGVTTTNVFLPSGCQPSGWAAGRNDGVTFTCTPAGSGHSITITNGCAPTAGRAVRFCAAGSGSGFLCVNGVIVGNTITFPPAGVGCVYLMYRITVTCCT